VGIAGVAQLVERQLPKLDVEGSNPFTRFGHDLFRMMLWSAAKLPLAAFVLCGARSWRGRRPGM
jgi:hypothetical protein